MCFFMSCWWIRYDGLKIGNLILTPKNLTQLVLFNFLIKFSFNSLSLKSLKVQNHLIRC